MLKIALSKPNGRPERTCTARFDGVESSWSFEPDKNGAVTTLAHGIISEFMLTDDVADVATLIMQRLHGDKPPESAKPEEIREMAWRPFPTELLPTEMRTFVKYNAKTLETDEANVALSALATAAGAIGNSRALELDPGWTVPALLWCAIVASQGTRKSAALDKATAPLDEIEDETGREIVVDDITIQALAIVLDENPSGLMSKRDELAQWFVALEEYQSSSSGKWCQLWNGGTLRQRRKGGEAKERKVVVKHACVTICGTIQPEILHDLLEAKHQHSGLAARWLFVSPPRVRGVYSRKGRSAAATAGYGRMIKDLYYLREGGRPDAGEEWDDDRPPPETGNLDSALVGQRLVLTLAEDAGPVWEDFVNACRDEIHDMLDEDDDDLLPGVLSKLEGLGGRLALILQLCEDPEATEVTLEWVKVGIQLSRWFWHESRRVWARAKGSPHAKFGKLIEWLKRKGPATAREVAQGPRRYRGAGGTERAEMDLRCLVTAGLATSKTVRTDGRPAEVFRVAEQP